MIESVSSAVQSLKGVPRVSPRTVRWAGGLLSVAALVALALLVTGTDWRDLARPLERAKLAWLAVAVGLALSVEVAKTVRWQLLLGIGLSARPDVLALVLGARLLNAVAPMRAGDVWRIMAVTRTERKSLPVAGGSVAAEKLLDGVALAVAGAALVWPGGSFSPGLPVAGIALLAGILLAAILAGRRWKSLGLARLVAGGDHLRAPRVLLGAGGLTVAAMVLGLTVNMLVLLALDLPVGLSAGLAMLLSGYAAGLVPAGPAQVGVYELAVASSLMAIGMSPASSVAAAVALHLVLLAAMGLGGAMSVPLGLLSRLAREKESSR